jgi:hypothetical protein
MDPARPRIVHDFPYPVAYPYTLIFDEASPPSVRRWALCFTEYQLLRTVCLPLVGQYLRAPIDEQAADSIRSLNRAVAAIRAPFFADWIALAYALRKHLPRVGVRPLFPQLDQALDALKQPEERPVGLRGRTRLAPLEAILALRNATAHGGMPDEEEAARHLEAFVPVLHHVLAAFDFLGDGTLKVRCDAPEVVATGRAIIRTLRGVRPAEAAGEDLSDELAEALAESEAALVTPDGRAVPLYPLLNPLPQREPLYLYDGHYGIRVEAREAVERSYIYYLGVYHRAEDTPSCARLRELLAARQISFFLAKEDTAPWTIADSAADYSRRTLEELRGTKYFPECYVPFADVERHLAAFLRVPDPARWPAEMTRARHVNGFLLAGLAGAGKTALLARLVEQLLAQSPAEAERENPNLVLFVRGNGIALRPEGMSLFRDVAEKLGVAVEGAALRSRSGCGFSSFRELLDHLHRQWRNDRVPGRRLILVLDALNEAPFAEQVIREALTLVKEAACFPWCKVVLSMRQEWLGIWSGKMGGQETSPLEEARPFLYVAEPGGERAIHGPPVVALEPFTEDQAAAAYRHYQEQARTAEKDGRGYAIPACRTPWEAIPAATRDLLQNPLYLHLFMEAFDSRPAEAVATVPALFRYYVDRSLQPRPGLRQAVEAVVGHLLLDLNRPSADLSDDDSNAIRQAWAEGLTEQEARLSLSPVVFG